MDALAFHPLADLFPLVTGREFDELVMSIKDNGLREPIALLDGRILDGRNRYRACAAAGVAPIFENFAGRDAVRFVIDKNLNRRHLSVGQRAMIAAKLANLAVGRPAETVEFSTITQAGAAELMNVSRDTVNCAKRVLREGNPDQIKGVEDGRLGCKTVARELRKITPGKTPSIARQESNRIRTDIWNHLRDALGHLASLPLPSEVASIVRAQDRGGLVDRRLEKSIKWLEDFADAWRNRDQTAAE